jgi:hypothetical protein
MTAMAKKVVAPLALASFLMVVFFGFVSMSNADGRMQSGCPFSAAGASLCPQDALAAAVHHLSAYQSFFSVPIGFSLTAFLMTLFAFSIALILYWSPPLLIPIASAEAFYESPPLSSHNKKRIRWLSLLENSPSFH